MASKVTASTPHVDQPFGWKVFKVEPTSTAAATYDDTITTLPKGTIILDAHLYVARAEAGATSSAVDIEIGATGAGDTTLLTADTGTIGVRDSLALDTVAALTTINTVGEAGTSDLVVNAEYAVVGTVTTTPIYYLCILCGRAEY